MNVWRFAFWIACTISATGFASPGPRGALEGPRLGLYEGRDFVLSDSRCAGCATIPQALWYFRDELVAVPRHSIAGFDASLRTRDDVRTWMAAHPSGDGTRPPLLWIGAPEVLEGARLGAGGRTITRADGKEIPFFVVQKIETNLSYYDDSSVRHLAGRNLRFRGRMQGDGFIARTIWPQDYALDAGALPYRPLGAQESVEALVRADEGGARQPLAARVLWRRDPGVAHSWNGKAVLAVMLNGAQGDDDEAHGGHFAIATGAFGGAGEWSDWLVNNFYNLDSVSEKGIIAATLPMDNYLADLNSGQSWYRPSYMLVAVLAQERTPRLYQEAIGRVYNHFYRHDFAYRHASANCTGISMETLREIGWRIPERGATSYGKALLALPYMAVKERNIESGLMAYDYLAAETTHLYPFVAFLAAGEDLLSLASGAREPGTTYERMLSEDVEAVLFVRIPQLPSSRAFGQAPVASIDEYMKRVPKDKADWKIVPVAARPFPPEMKDPRTPPQPQRAAVYGLFAYTAVFFLLAVFIWSYKARKRRTGR